MKELVKIINNWFFGDADTADPNIKWTWLFSGGIVAIIVCFAMFPLFFNLPFRDNIYLSWEGAYRMYLGQIPFKDFGLPLGYAYWILPALSFHLLGPYFISLIKVQVLINIISGFAFFRIQRTFCKDPGLLLAGVLVYVMSFSFYNFWPWYNHTVIVYEFVALAFLLVTVFRSGNSKVTNGILYFLSSFFCFLSFFTKQDGGAMALFVCGLIILYDSLSSRSWFGLLTFGGGYLLSAFLFIGPLLSYEFGYWFNYGQPPHYSRLNILDFLTAILGKSEFIKLYFLIVVLIVLAKSRDGWGWIKDRQFSVHLILTLCILFQAAVLQVTSYVPADGNIYFHSFMFAFIVSNLNLNLRFYQLRNFVPLLLVIGLWWSGLYWKYANRMFSSLFSSSKGQTENVVSSTTFVIEKDTTWLNKSDWILSEYPSFKKIKIPKDVEESMKKIEKWYDAQPNRPKVLNMSELTPLAEILGYELESGSPLWYHLNVALFDRELEMFKNRIEKRYYDLVLFEYIPHLSNFYPFEVRRDLQKNYELWFTFQAPREVTSEVIEVYIKKDN